MLVYVIRHGQALDTGPGQLDSDRELSEVGRAQAARLAALFAAGAAPFEARPSRLMSSNAVRASLTAVPIALALGIPVEQDRRLAPSAGPGDTMELLIELALGKAPVSLIVGHNPGLSVLVRRFGGGELLATGELALLEIAPGAAESHGRTLARVRP